MGFTRGLLMTLAVAVVSYMIFSYFDSPTPFDGASLLAGKNVVITGASSGIGEQLAYWYARFGANVYLTARREELLKQIVAKCELEKPSDSNKIGYFVADMSSESDRESFVQNALSFLGEDIDQLVLNHGRVLSMNHWQGSREDVERVQNIMEVNFVSHVHVLALSLAALTRTNGSVGVVGSYVGRTPAVYVPEYSGSKAAMDVFFSALRHEFKATGRNVSLTNGVIGAVATDVALESLDTAIKNSPTPEKVQFIKDRAASPSDAALAILTATTLRKDELYYPTNQYLYPLCVARAIWPTWMEDMGIR